MRTHKTIRIAIILIGLATLGSFLPNIGKSLDGSKSLLSTGSIDMSMRWLQTVNDTVANSNGQIVHLQGFDLVSTQTRTAFDYNRLKSWGVTVVRFPMRWDWLEPEPGNYSQTYLTKIDNEIALARNYRIYVILDMHQWHWSTAFTVHNPGPYYQNMGFGFPPWLCSIYPDTDEGYNQTVNDFWSGKGPNGTIPSLSNPSQQDRFIAVWKLIASRYANEPTVAAYDLFNEPPRGVLNWTQHADVLYPFYNRLMTEIRKVDTRHILNYEPSCGYATYYAKKIDQPNTSLSVNFYSLRQNYNGDSSALKAAFDDLYNPIRSWNIPFIISEVGIETSQPNFTLWANDVLTVISDYDLSWMWFAYYKNDSPSFAVLYSNGVEKTEITSIIKPYLE